jgi:hypothetical protein
MKIHNQTVRKDLGGNDFSEGLERAEAWGPVFLACTFASERNTEGKNNEA